MTADQAVEAVRSHLRHDETYTTGELAQAADLDYQTCHLALRSLRRSKRALRSPVGRWYAPAPAPAERVARAAVSKRTLDEVVSAIGAILSPRHGQDVVSLAARAGISRRECESALSVLFGRKLARTGRPGNWYAAPSEVAKKEAKAFRKPERDRAKAKRAEWAERTSAARAARVAAEADLWERSSKS